MLQQQKRLQQQPQQCNSVMSTISLLLICSSTHAFSPVATTTHHSTQSSSTLGRRHHLLNSNNWLIKNDYSSNNQYLHSSRRSNLMMTPQPSSTTTTDTSEENITTTTTTTPTAINTDIPTTTTTALSAVSENSNETPVGPFEVGGGPTIIIEDDESSSQIYKEAISRTLLWVVASGIFGVGLWILVGPQTSQEFYAGYLIEQSLSVDNLFVFLLLFEFFNVPLKCQDRVLNWGIYGAVVMRALMIGLGAAALQQFHAILLVFAGILVYSSVNALFGDDDEDEDMNDNAIVKFSKKIIDYTDTYDGDRFFTMVEGVKKATPLFICMIAIELADVVFAVDSIPAVFGVTSNPLVVFTSNMFAIMGLRSLYTILSKAASDLKYLEPAIALVLGFIGGKMIGEYFGYEISTTLSLSVVVLLLGSGIGASIYDKQQTATADEEA